MAPTPVHILIGERVFAQTARLSAQPALYGPFLLGCVLVDANNLVAGLARDTTHFASSYDETHPQGYHASCDNFLAQLPQLLLRPWPLLSGAEQAFAAGYLCHLAADQEWKRYDWQVFRESGLRWWADLPVPSGVLMTEFTIACNELYRDLPAAAAALRGAEIPSLFSHLSPQVLQTAWDFFKIACLRPITLEAYLALLATLGKPPAEIEHARQNQGQFGAQAQALLASLFGSVEARVEAMVQFALSVLPRLWGE